MRPSLQERLDQDRPPGIDLAPMLDTVFNLLIFFIIASAFVQESGVEIEKPEAVTATRLKNDFIVIAITPTGEVWYDRNNIGVEGVRSTVAALLLAEDQVELDDVAEQGQDDDAPHDQVVRERE